MYAGSSQLDEGGEWYGEMQNRFRGPWGRLVSNREGGGSYDLEVRVGMNT